jgi:aryl-alcohol dehydrogenase
MVFGHEGAGTVTAAGPSAGLRAGQPVVLTFASCGECENCAADQPAYCRRSTDLNMRGGRDALRHDGRPITGGFFGQSSLATYALARSRNAVPVDDLDPAVAAPLGCSVQTGVGTVLNTIAPRPDEAIAIFGVGAVGLSAVMGARIAGCQTIVAIDPVAERRTLATELGATAALDPTAPDAAATVVELTGGGAHAAIDTTAIPDVLTTALTVLRPRGMLAIVGLGVPTAALPVGLIMGSGLTVRGVVEGDSDPQVFIPRLAKLVRSGALPLDKLVTRFAFDDFGAGWTAARTGRVVKPVLVT